MSVSESVSLGWLPEPEVEDRGLGHAWVDEFECNVGTGDDAWPSPCSDLQFAPDAGLQPITVECSLLVHESVDLTFKEYISSSDPSHASFHVCCETQTDSMADQVNGSHTPGKTRQPLRPAAGCRTMLKIR